jgi:hypothetical protein
MGVVPSVDEDVLAEGEAFNFISEANTDFENSIIEKTATRYWNMFFTC